MARARSERGQVAPLVAVLVLVAGGAALLLADLGGAALARASARTAADAAALAGAAEGRPAAERLAAANGGVLDAFAVHGADTEVTVRVGPARATARARATPAGGGTTGGGAREGLAPAMVAALRRAEQLLNRPVPITSGWRSREEQAALYARRGSNPYPVARPGSSMHERGLAIDVARHFVDDLLGVAGAAGLCQPLPSSDPVHFEPCRWTRAG